jgi:hypothetical protein
VGIVLLFDLLRRYVGRSAWKFLHRFPLSFLFNRHDALARPAESRHIVYFRGRGWSWLSAAEFPIPVGSGRCRFQMVGVFFVTVSAGVVVLLVLVFFMQRFGY